MQTLTENKSNKAQQTRQKIIQCAKELFRKYGYQKTTLQMIADKSDISVSLIKKYFQQKKALALVISRQQAFTIKKYVDTMLDNTDYKGDALMEYLLTIHIMFRNLYQDPASRKFHYDQIEEAEKSGDIRIEIQSSDYISELYENIVKQFNTGMTPNEFKARKIQILAAQNAIGKMYIENDDFTDDLTRLEYSVSAACILLGVSNFIYSNYKNHAYKLLENVDVTQFNLL